MTQTEPEQRHPIFPSQVVDAPEDYPEPKAGLVTRLSLTTPEKVPVGTLLHDDKGLAWTPANTEDISAQEHAAEILSYLRGNKNQGTQILDTIEGIKEAYVGDFTEDKARFIPSR